MQVQPKYKTAEELGVREKTRVGLERLMRDLASGRVPPNKFSMRRWRGSACCLGGHLEARGELHVEDHASLDYYCPSLIDLFYPEEVGKAMLCIDPLRGALATLNFLTLADARWARVMDMTDNEVRERLGTLTRPW